MKLQMKLQGFDGEMPKGKYIAPEKKKSNYEDHRLKYSNDISKINLFVT